MAMTWFQKMFTPERSGSYEWQDRVADSGEVSTGDIQDLIFKPRAHRGPGNTVGQNLMPQAYVAQDGDGYPTGEGDYDSAGMEDVASVSISSGPGGTDISAVDEMFIPAVATAAFKGYPSMRGVSSAMTKMPTGMRTGFRPSGMLSRIGPETGMRTVRGGGMLPRLPGGAMTKVNPGGMHGITRQALPGLGRGAQGLASRPHLGLDPNKLLGSTNPAEATVPKSSWGWRDLLRLLPAGIAGGLLEPESGSYRPVRSTGIRGLDDPNWVARRKY